MNRSDTPLASSFVQARHYTPRRNQPVTMIVIHDMESSETVKTAENVASWFAGPSAPQASAHYCVDSDSTVQCVAEMDVAWHAPGANHCAVGIEMAGRANQTLAQWNDPFSKLMGLRTAMLCVDIMRRRKIPNVFLTAKDLVAGKWSGITTHNEVSKAFKRSTHTDPGPQWPRSAFMATITGLLVPK